MAAGDEVMTSAEAAAYLRISLRTLQSIQGTRKGPPGAKLGRQWRYSKAALDAWLARGPALGWS